MGFYEQIKQYQGFDIESYIKKVTAQDLSPAAIPHLKMMAQMANLMTIKNFGRVILLYTPIYLADYCLNECVYCGFNVKNEFKRSKLTIKQLEEVALNISKTGLKHVLILTGESRTHTPVRYIEECTLLLRKFFTSVSIEVYPMEEFEYERLALAGVDGITIYQEVYDESIYDSLHKSGPKKNYHYRLDAPERAAQAGLRTVSIGALLGLNDFKTEIFFTGLHAKYLQKKFWDIEVGVSLPRFRPHLGNFVAPFDISDRDFVQALIALRIFLPRCGISISTREDPHFRENIIPLGVTKMSAGVSTNVGGHIMHGESKSQFEISDSRSVAQIKEMLENKGYQPTFVDWR
jgi:2-iminoacetate synthase